MSVDLARFDPAYTVVVDPEFPGNGEWGCPTYGFRRDGTVVVPFEGVAYLVDVTKPELGAVLVREPVTQVVPMDKPPRLLLTDFIEITAIGPSGAAWRTTRLCVDGLLIESASEREIVCSCDNLDGRETITIDPASGVQTGGRRMDDPGTDP